MTGPIEKDGKWWVEDKSFKTNEAAWRYIDKQNNEAMSRSAAAHSWYAEKWLRRYS